MLQQELKIEQLGMELVGSGVTLKQVNKGEARMCTTVNPTQFYVRNEL